MLLATGLVISHWIGLLTGVIVFAIGHGGARRSEESFCASLRRGFEAYAAKSGRSAFSPLRDPFERAKILAHHRPASRDSRVMEALIGRRR